MTYAITYIECRSAPSQAAGLTEGRPFYFRSRHGEWTLEVGQAGIDPHKYSGGPLTYPGDGGECYGPELVAWGEHEEYPSEETILAVLDEHLGEGSEPKPPPVPRTAPTSTRGVRQDGGEQRPNTTSDDASQVPNARENE